MVQKVIVLSLISAIAYRFGGLGDDGKKYFPFLPRWMFDTKIRDVGCSLISLMLYISLNCFVFDDILTYLLVFGLSWAALSTYWDWLFGSDNLYFHGFMIGLAWFPIRYCGVMSLIILSRAMLLALIFGMLNLMLNKFKIKFSDWIEESMRGFLLVCTISMLT